MALGFMPGKDDGMKRPGLLAPNQNAAVGALVRRVPMGGLLALDAEQH